jgi:hypothetical protein
VVDNAKEADILGGAADLGGDLIDAVLEVVQRNLAMRSAVLAEDCTCWTHLWYLAIHVLCLGGHYEHQVDALEMG